MSSEEIIETPSRAPDGKFLKGHAPVPGSGRKPGIAQSELVRAKLEPHRDQLIDEGIRLAMQNDDLSAKARGLEICLTRLAPSPRESEKVRVDGLAEAQGFAAKCDAVIQAVSAGEISAEAGERVLRLLDVYRKAFETDELARRIEALEGKRTVTIGSKPEGVKDLL